MSHNSKYYIKSLKRNKVKSTNIRSLLKKKKTNEDGTDIVHIDSEDIAENSETVNNDVNKNSAENSETVNNDVNKNSAENSETVNNDVNKNSETVNKDQPGENVNIVAGEEQSTSVNNADVPTCSWVSFVYLCSLLLFLFPLAELYQ